MKIKIKRRIPRVSLSHLQPAEIHVHFRRRLKTHNRLVNHLKGRKKKEYVELALGLTDPAGNYSAAEHGLGEPILQNNSVDSVVGLAEAMLKCPSADDLPDLIYGRGLPYLKISVGSEMAMMIAPSRFWVGNMRSIYAHLLVKHGDDYEKADAEWSAYRGGDWDSEMEYHVWRDVYPTMSASLDKILYAARRWSHRYRVDEAAHRYLWSDAIASALYNSSWD